MFALIDIVDANTLTIMFKAYVLGTYWNSAFIYLQE